MGRVVEDDDALARARTRTIRIVVAVWVPLLLVGVGVAAWVLDPFEWRTGCVPSAGAVDDAAGAGWEGLSDAPVATVRASALAWTGDELIVLGGNAGVGREVCPVRDGAAYDPTTGSWRMLSTPPFDPLYQVQARWTGDELFVVGQPCSSQATPEDSVPGCRPGGLAAAGYDPDRDRWRTIDIDADVSDGLNDDAVLFIVGWDGDEVILRGPDRLVAFSPVGDRWRLLPDAPPQFRDGLCVASDALIAVDVFRPDIIVDTVEERDDTSPLVSVSTDGGAWSKPLSSGTGASRSPAATPVCAGDRVLVVEVGFDSTTAAWSAVSLAPREVGFFQQGQAAWTGDRLVLVTHNAISSYEPDTDTWRVHGPTDAPGSWQPIWAGDALVYPAAQADGETTLIAVQMPA